MTLLQISDLSVTYTRDDVVTALSGVDLTMSRGEIVGVVGESGSGKTTLGMAIPRLLGGSGTISSGRIVFDGQDLTDCAEEELRMVRGSRIAVVFQDPSTSLNPVLTVGEQLAETVRMHRSTGESTSVWTESLRKFAGPLARRGTSWSVAVRMLARMGMPDPEAYAKRYPHQLSGGMRQRASIATALSCEPDLLIADEPTTALDVTVQATVLRELVDLVRDLGTSVLLITHDLDVAAQFCDRIAVMYGGQLVEVSSAREVFENAQNPYTQALLASQPRLDSDRGPLLGLAGDVPDLSKEQVGCRFAARCPEALADCRTDPPALNPLSERLVLHDSDHQCRCIRRESAYAGGTR
ncbi:MAG: ABC transporter ATP-binding protein [Nocardioidaceae bacterium]